MCCIIRYVFGKVCDVDILGRLPHRYPFLMVDRVLEVLPGVRAVGVMNVTGGRPPEIMVLEALAQLSALAAPEQPGGSAQVSGYLAGIHDAKFTGYPKAGDRVILKVEFVARMGGMVRFNGTASVGDDLLVESGLTFTVSGG